MSLGYCAKAEILGDEPVNIIFDKSNFIPVYRNDLMNTSREVLIVSPFVTKRRVLQIRQHISTIDLLACAR
jgi:hypothetical protein